MAFQEGNSNNCNHELSFSLHKLQKILAVTLGELEFRDGGYLGNFTARSCVGKVTSTRNSGQKCVFIILSGFVGGIRNESRRRPKWRRRTFLFCRCLTDCPFTVNGSNDVGGLLTN